MTRAPGQRWLSSHFWEAPHRPLFLASFLCAFATVAWWPLGVGMGVPAPGFEPVVLWHAHELIFGFAGAAVGGYLLTALPSWTGMPLVRGSALKTLLLLWLLSRLTTALADQVPVALLLILNAGYSLYLAAIIIRRTLSCGLYSKTGFGLAVLCLGTADTLFMAAALTGNPEVSLAIARVVLVGFALLITIIGGKAIPAFTNNWLGRTNRQDLRIKDARLPRLIAQGALTAALITLLNGLTDTAGFALICAAIAILCMMHRWRTITALTNPLLAAQHLAFAWIPFGLAAIGTLWLVPQIYPTADALHALTIGAMSGLIMAIAGRAACHHISGDMRANTGFVLGTLLIWITSWGRLLAPIFDQHTSTILLLASGLWCLAWAVFIAGFHPALAGPVVLPILSGKKHQHAALQSLLTEKRT